MVAAPKADRWHKKPTAMLGGGAIFLSFSLIYLVAIPHTRQHWVVYAGSAFLFLLGLADDILHIKPYQKLIGQLMGASSVIFFGLTLPWTGSPLLNMGITAIWIVGITNALNLLDNMDGLAAGIGGIAAIFLAVNFHMNGQPLEATMIGVFAATLLGFLVYNSNPASIFMGDCGSMFIGFLLASATLLSSTGIQSRSFLPVLAVPVLILFIPIFDTTFVTLLRKLSGRAASQGGRDHTSHRLVALGLSERHAVWLLYGFATFSGLLALFVQRKHLDISLAAIVGFTVILTLVGVHLAGVKVYDEDEILKSKDTPLVAFLVDLSYKRRVFEVLLDVCLITLSYYFAYALTFGPWSERGDWQMFVMTLPVIVFVKLISFLVMGVYRGIWRYTSMDNLVGFAKAVSLGSALSMIALLFAFHFVGFSRVAFALDGLLLMILLTTSRLTFRFFRTLIPVRTTNPRRRTLIYGAGDGGELLLRELHNNHELEFAASGFVDDDVRKIGKVIHGLRVYPAKDLKLVCEQLGATEVIVSTSRLPVEKLRDVSRMCDEASVGLKRMTIHIEELTATLLASEPEQNRTSAEGSPSMDLDVATLAPSHPEYGLEKGIWKDSLTDKAQAGGLLRKSKTSVDH